VAKLVDSLDKYVRQSMTANPEWSAGLLAIEDMLLDRRKRTGTRAAPSPAPTLSETIPHVWTVDGQPLGVRHEIRYEAGMLVVRDIGIEADGAERQPDEARIPFVEAVHVLLNLTPDERRYFASERTQRPRWAGLSEARRRSWIGNLQDSLDDARHELSDEDVETQEALIELAKGMWVGKGQATPDTVTLTLPLKQAAAIGLFTWLRAQGFEMAGPAAATEEPPMRTLALTLRTGKSIQVDYRIFGDQVVEQGIYGQGTYTGNAGLTDDEAEEVRLALAGIAACDAAKGGANV
jgi:hypothetical protein